MGSEGKVEEKEEATAVRLGIPGNTGLAQRDTERGWRASLEWCAGSTDPPARRARTNWMIEVQKSQSCPSCIVLSLCAAPAALPRISGGM